MSKVELNNPDQAPSKSIWNSMSIPRRKCSSNSSASGRDRDKSTPSCQSSAEGLREKGSAVSKTIMPRIQKSLLMFTRRSSSDSSVSSGMWFHKDSFDGSCCSELSEASTARATSSFDSYQSGILPCTSSDSSTGTLTSLLDSEFLEPTFQDFVRECEEDCEDQMQAVTIACKRLDEAMLRRRAKAATEMAGPTDDMLGVFESKLELPCSASQYILRMIKYGETSFCNVIIALIFLHRAKSCYPSLKLTPNNAQRLLLTAVMVATKFWDDVHYNNKFWAKIGELELTEMNTLEIVFLMMINLSCHVHREEYDAFVNLLPQPGYMFLEEGPICTRMVAQMAL